MINTTYKIVVLCVIGQMGASLTGNGRMGCSMAAATTPTHKAKSEKESGRKADALSKIDD